MPPVSLLPNWFLAKIMPPVKKITKMAARDATAVIFFTLHLRCGIRLPTGAGVLEGTTAAPHPGQNVDDSLNSFWQILQCFLPWYVLGAVFTCCETWVFLPDATVIPHPGQNVAVSFKVLPHCLQNFFVVFGCATVCPHPEQNTAVGLRVLLQCAQAMINTPFTVLVHETKVSCQKQIIADF